MNVRSTLVSNSISYLQVYNVGTASSVSTFKVYYRFDKHESLLRRKGKTSPDYFAKKKRSFERIERYLIPVRERIPNCIPWSSRYSRTWLLYTILSRIFLNLSSLSLSRSFVSSFSFSRQPYITCRFRLYLAFKISRVRPICNSVGEKKRKEKKRKDEGTTMKTDELFIRFLE